MQRRTRRSKPFRKAHRCPSGKIGYPTEALASEALASARVAASKGSARRRERRIYYHDLCDSYHLSSKE